MTPWEACKGRTLPSVTLTILLSILAGGCAGRSPEKTVEAREGYLEGAGDARLFYRVIGSGPDTVFVVHGGPGAGMGSVLPDFAPLAETATLVFYDQRGGGRSALPADTTLLDARYFVEDLEEVRRHFGADRVTLLTHSFGSVLAASYAERYPERLERMIFHGATGPVRAAAAALARRAPSDIDSTAQHRLRGVMEKLLSGTASDPVAACRRYEELSGSGDPGKWSGTTCAASPEAVRYYYRYTAQLTPRSFGDWDFTCRLREVDAPLLVIHGDRDSLAIPQQRAWAAAAPNGRLLVIPGAGKGAIADRPELVVSAIATFLDGAWPEDTRVPNSHSAPRSCS